MDNNIFDQTPDVAIAMLEVDKYAHLRQQYGKIYLIDFNNPNDTGYDAEYPSCEFVFKKMDFDLFAATSALAVEKPIQAIKTQMEATMVQGDKSLLNDPVVLGSLAKEFAKISALKQAALKKI